MESEYVGVSPFRCLESIYGHEYEYISFLAQEYKYISPWEKSIWAQTVSI